VRRSPHSSPSLLGPPSRSNPGPHRRRAQQAEARRCHAPRPRAAARGG
jgi:hypothetical protein